MSEPANGTRKARSRDQGLPRAVRACEEFDKVASWDPMFVRFDYPSGKRHAHGILTSRTSPPPPPPRPCKLGAHPCLT